MGAEGQTIREGCCGGGGKVAAEVVEGALDAVDCAGGGGVVCVGR